MRKPAVTSTSVLLALLLGPAACRKSDGCPEGMEAVREGSVAGKHLLCRRGGDEAGEAVRIDFQPGTTTPRQLCPLRAGRLEGEFRALHPDGKVFIKGAYAAGVEHGPWTQWGPDGGKVAQGEYREGRLVAGAPVAMAAACKRAR